MNVLGIETSCDETSAAVVRDGRQVLSNVVATQVALHRPYGGVVPEIASRSHLETLPGVILEAVNRSGLAWNQIDAVAATYGPGLASSLLVGLSAGKGLAWRLGQPFHGINHLEAHIYSLFLGEEAPDPGSICPFVTLVVSGGHTCLVRVEALGSYHLMGRTIDDAAGEAFDKGANLMGLGYPGGPAIDRLSREGDGQFVRFPRGRQKHDRSPCGGLNADLCFSFSGVKTALLYYLKAHPSVEGDGKLPSVAASFQEAIVDALVRRCEKAVCGVRTLGACGGVSLNSRLRAALKAMAERLGIRLLLAEPRFCADNAAMVAGLAGAGGGVGSPEAMGLDAQPNLGIGQSLEVRNKKGDQRE